MEDFLADNNACGQILLHLVSRGNAIIAELLRLKGHVPQIFRLETKLEQQKYGEIIMDFTYFSSSDENDKKIEADEKLHKLYNEIREAHGGILTRFYKAFESVHKYVTDLNSFIEELEDGMFIHKRLDSILLNQDGTQLLCECVYVYGVMLLILDLYHPGVTRERLVVSYSRYFISASTLDHVCHLVRSTGFFNTQGVKKPQNYPQDYFQRVPLHEKLVSSVIGKLRTEDIYHQQKALPLPQHMTTALAQQSVMLFVALFFAPNILHNQTARMREIVDKYFPDSWVVSVYMGITMNLIEMWEPFRAARIALANTLDPSNIRDYAVTHTESLNKLLSRTNEILKEGAFVKKTLMKNPSKILSLARDCNVTLRWLVLHTSPQLSMHESLRKCKQARDQVLSDTNYDQGRLFELLLNTAHFENRATELLRSIFEEREEKWKEAKQESSTRIQELSEIFGGTTPLLRISRNDNLKKWFLDIGAHIESLNLEEPNISARKIVQLIQAIEEVQGFEATMGSMQVKQLLLEACESLQTMLGAANLRDIVLVQMQIIGDFNYGWLLVDGFTKLMQEGLKKDPSLVQKLRALFLKLSSAMETSLLRINQAGSLGDLSSVSGHYSQQLVAYVKRLLQIIPESVFNLMSSIAVLQTLKIPELPPRVEKDKLKELAQLENRLEVARLTHQVSVFSAGLLNMESTLVGIVRVDPKQLLEDGICKELAQHISQALDEGICFNPKLKGSDVPSKLDELGNIMDGHKRSFEYIQDYMGINGVKMWQREMNSAISSSVDSECRRLEGKYDGDHPPAFTFMGRLAQQILILTDPKSTIYVSSEVAWYDLKTKKKIADSDFFGKILKAMGVPGLRGLDKIFGIMIVKTLQDLIKFLQNEAQNNKSWLQIFGTIAKDLTPIEHTVAMPKQVYMSVAGRVHQLTSGTLDPLVAAGQLQTLRRVLLFTLNCNAKCKARNYASSLINLNSALLNQVRRVEQGLSDVRPSDAELGQVSELLDWIGHTEPLSKVYITTRSIPYAALLIFIFTFGQIGRFQYDKPLDSLICKRTGEGIAPLLMGIVTLLNQFHVSVRRHFVSYCSQYVKSFMLFNVLNSKFQDAPPEALSMLQFLEEYVDYSSLGRSELIKHIPPLIIDFFRHGVNTYIES